MVVCNTIVDSKELCSENVICLFGVHKLQKVDMRIFVDTGLGHLSGVKDINTLKLMNLLLAFDITQGIQVSCKGYINHS